MKAQKEYKGLITRLFKSVQTVLFNFNCFKAYRNFIEAIFFFSFQAFLGKGMPYKKKEQEKSWKIF